MGEITAYRLYEKAYSNNKGIYRENVRLMGGSLVSAFFCLVVCLMLGRFFGMADWGIGLFPTFRHFPTLLKNKLIFAAVLAPPIPFPTWVFSLPVSPFFSIGGKRHIRNKVAFFEGGGF